MNDYAPLSGASCARTASRFGGMAEAITTFGGTTTGRTVSVDGKIKSRHSANATLKQAGLKKVL